MLPNPTITAAATRQSPGSTVEDIDAPLIEKNAQLINPELEGTAPTNSRRNRQAAASNINVPLPQQTGSSSDGNTTGGDGGQATGVGDIKFPSGCLSVHGYGIGVDYDSPPAALTNAMGAKPCVYGRYVDYKQGITAQDLTAGDGVTNANSIGTIYMLSLKTATYPTGQAAVALAKAVNSMAAGVTEGVWLRLGFEMTIRGPESNWPNDPTTYKRMWMDLYPALDKAKVKAFWCANPPTTDKFPDQNWNDLSWMTNWFPGANYVDIVGLDTYAASGGSPKFRDGLAPIFCETFGKNKAVFIGELGVSGGGSDQAKLDWATQALGTDVKGSNWCPNYIGYAWFEISKSEGQFQAASNGILAKAVKAAA